MDNLDQVVSEAQAAFAAISDPDALEQAKRVHIVRPDALTIEGGGLRTVGPRIQEFWLGGYETKAITVRPCVRCWLGFIWTPRVHTYSHHQTAHPHPATHPYPNDDRRGSTPRCRRPSGPSRRQRPWRRCSRRTRPRTWRAAGRGAGRARRSSARWRSGASRCSFC